MVKIFVEKNFQFKDRDYEYRHPEIKLYHGKRYSVVKYEKEVCKGRVSKFFKALSATFFSLGLALFSTKVVGWWEKSLFGKNIKEIYTPSPLEWNEILIMDKVDQELFKSIFQTISTTIFDKIFVLGCKKGSDLAFGLDFPFNDLPSPPARSLLIYFLDEDTRQQFENPSYIEKLKEAQPMLRQFFEQENKCFFMTSDDIVSSVLFSKPTFSRRLRTLIIKG